MRKVRKTFNEASSERVRHLFKVSYSYNPEDGEITNIRKNKQYKRLSKKGYKESIYMVVDDVEYRATYHRLCWFLQTGDVIPDNMQIDHKDNVKDNNKWENLRLCTNDENSRKKLLRKDNKTGYRGTHQCNDRSHGKTFTYYAAVISYGKGPTKIGRFKNLFHAAIFYDSACRYYFKDFANCNFEKEYLKPMSIEELRIHKKSKEPLPEMDDKQ